MLDLESETKAMLELKVKVNVSDAHHVCRCLLLILARENNGCCLNQEI